MKCIEYIGPSFLFFITMLFPILYYYTRFSFSSLGFSDFKIYQKILFILEVITIEIPCMMTIYCIIKSVCSDAGETRKVLYSNKYRVNNPFMTDEFLDGLPKCEKCGLPKPPRAHHCSRCGCCHLRMDHHCPALGKCVALRNHQSFMALLSWGSVTIGVLEIWILIDLFMDLQNWFMNILFFVMMLVLFFTTLCFRQMQMNQIKRNCTTIERMDGNQSEYDIGAEENVRQVLGSSKWRLFLPQESALTGFEWALPQYKDGGVL